MLAKANFNNESSTEVLFPPHQETQMKRQIFHQPLLQPMCSCQAPAVPKLRQNPLKRPCKRPQDFGRATFFLTPESARKKAQPRSLKVLPWLWEAEGFLVYLFVAYHRTGPISTLHGLFHLILLRYALILQMKKLRLGAPKELTLVCGARIQTQAVRFQGPCAQPPPATKLRCPTENKRGAQLVAAQLNLSF